MKLLFLIPQLASPPRSGGEMRIHSLMQQLAKRHEIAVLAFKPAGSQVQESVAATGEYARLVAVVQNPNIGVPLAAKRRDQLCSLATTRSYASLTYGIPGLQRSLDRLAGTWKPDVVVAEFAQMGYVDFPDGVPVVLDAHNLEHEIISRSARVEGSFARRLYSRVESFKLRREEVRLVRRVDGLAVTSERDGRAFEQLAPGICPVIVPNGVDSQAMAPLGGEERDRDIVFFGAMDYFPNVDAVLHFYRHVWPRLRSRYPDLRLTIVGRDPAPSVRELEGQPGVEVTGVVDDIRERVGHATVVVVPLRAGSGTRLKVIEAMSLARPVVSTPLGVEGLDVVDGTHLLIANSDEEFADAVGRLLDSEDERRRIGLAARDLVESRYDWAASVRALENLLRAVVERSATRTDVVS